MFERHLLSASEMPKMAKDSGGFVKSKAKGTVNFPPFENLDEVSIRETKQYHIYPFGKIQEYCRHIPYNSGKKDFYEKTGRESFEGEPYTTIRRLPPMTRRLQSCCSIPIHLQDPR